MAAWKDWVEDDRCVWHCRVKKLNDAGVYHFWQLAAMSEGDIAKLDGDLKLSGRSSRDGWVDQARSLASA
jgi:small subunit ribosomal protein S2